jgi:hypothetical protein
MKQDEIDAARMQKGSIEAVLRLLPAGLVHQEISEALSRIDARIAQTEENQDVAMPEAPSAAPASSLASLTQASQLQEYRKLQSDRLALQKKIKVSDGLVVEGGTKLDFIFTTEGKLGLVWDNMQPGRIKEVKGCAEELGLKAGDRAFAIDDVEVPPHGESVSLLLLQLPQ